MKTEKYRYFELELKDGRKIIITKNHRKNERRCKSNLLR